MGDRDELDLLPPDCLLPCDPPQVVPTIERALDDVRKRVAKITGLTFSGVRVSYEEHDEFGTEDFEFEGMSVAQLVPFCELALRQEGAQVPTIQCPACIGRNVKNCPKCKGLGKVLPSQVTSQQAAASPTLDKYRE